MTLKDWLIQKFGATKTVTVADLMADTEMQDAITEATTREIAFWTCVNRIANIMTKCELKTYRNGREIQEAEHYLWNVEPNRNQNAAAFWKKLIGELYRKNEALVIEQGGELYVADSFGKEITAFSEYIYDAVMIDGISITRRYRQSEVLYFSLNDVDMRPLINGIYSSYQKITKTAEKIYKKSLGNRGILNISAQAQADKNFSSTLQNLMQNYFKPFFEKDNAVLPLFEGYNYENQSEKSSAVQATSRDLKALTDDIYDFTARAFCLSPSIVKGSVENNRNAIDETIMMCIEPLLLMISQEINRKRFGETDFKSGTYVKFDTSKAKHIELTDIAAAVEKLVSSGVYTINEIRKAFDLEPIQEEWADRHYMTKNFATIEEILNPTEGGESDAKTENLLQNGTGAGSE